MSETNASVQTSEMPRALQRGGERCVDGPPSGGSATPAPHMPGAQSMGIPLLDLLHREIARAGKAPRAAPAECIFSREVRCQ